MSKLVSSNPHPDAPMVYEIRVKGHLGEQWTEWFDGLAVTLNKNGDTLLTGAVIDQAALYGLLKRVRDLGMPLLSLNPVKSRGAEGAHVKPLRSNRSDDSKKGA